MVLVSAGGSDAQTDWSPGPLVVVVCSILGPLPAVVWVNDVDGKKGGAHEKGQKSSSRAKLNGGSTSTSSSRSSRLSFMFAADRLALRSLHSHGMECILRVLFGDNSTNGKICFGSPRQFVSIFKAFRTRTSAYLQIADPIV